MMHSGFIGLLIGRGPWSAARAATLLGFLLPALLIVGCGSDDPTPVTPSGPTTAAGYTNRGWERFEAADFSGAQSDFNAAINRDASYGAAHAGQGWARLALATSSNAMQAATGSFATAILNGEFGAYVFAGRAASNLGSGDAFLVASVGDAQAALAVDASFTFSHRTSFNAADLHLIEAFAEAGQGDFPNALAAADLVLDSGIDAGTTGTWQVDGTGYDSFVGAVLAHLHKVSGQYSG
jgi:hypothetical protein